MCDARFRCFCEFTKNYFQLKGPSGTFPSNSDLDTQKIMDMENNIFLAGTFVIEYCGEIVDIPEAHRRLETSASEGVTNYYILALDKVFSICFVS